MAVIALVRVARPRAQTRPRLGKVEEPPTRRDLFDGGGRESDLRDLEFAAQLRARIRNVAVLCKAKGYGQRRAHRRAHHGACIRIDARGDIDRDHRRAGLIDRLDGTARESLHLGVESDAEDRVDDYTRAPAHRCAEFGLATDFNHRSAGLDELGMRSGRIALKRRCVREQYRAHRQMLGHQDARGDHPVTAVVALARDDQHAVM